jgi:hypothetical protein
MFWAHLQGPRFFGSKMFIITGHLPTMGNILNHEYVQIRPTFQALVRGIYVHTDRRAYDIPESQFIVFRHAEKV